VYVDSAQNTIYNHDVSADIFPFLFLNGFDAVILSV